MPCSKHRPSAEYTKSVSAFHRLSVRTQTRELNLQLNLIDISEDLYEAWKRVFHGLPDVCVWHDDIFAHPCDAIVSPANSFGFMNGGLDFSISKHLGWHIEKRLQEIIRRRHFGELLVGQAEIVPTDHPEIPWVVSAPTMRVPMTIVGSPNSYLAMRAILLLLRHGLLQDGRKVSEVVRSVAIPGLGTGVGQMPPLTCARQMRIAWEDVTGNKHSTLAGWEQMRSNYAFLVTGLKEHLRYDIA